MSEFDDRDLFQPTLTSADDANFDRPWNPWWILLIGFFFGLYACGLLLAENWRRLGRASFRTPTLLGTWALQTVLLAGIVLFWIPADAESKSLARILMRVVTLAVAVPIAYRQEKRFRLALSCKAAKGRLWIWATAAVIVNMLLAYLVLFAIHGTLVALGVE